LNSIKDPGILRIGINRAGPNDNKPSMDYLQQIVQKKTIVVKFGTKHVTRDM
jgi:hypothetical protein